MRLLLVQVTFPLTEDTECALILVLRQGLLADRTATGGHQRLSIVVNRTQKGGTQEGRALGRECGIDGWKCDTPIVGRGRRIAPLVANPPHRAAKTPWRRGVVFPHLHGVLVRQKPAALHGPLGRVPSPG